MKKLALLFVCFLSFSCDDGDFNLPAFDFDETVYNCDVIDNNYTLFRLANAESLIVTLSTQQIKNEITTTPIEVPITSSNVIYRTFDGEVSSSYFCDPIPPVDPKVVSNWTGVEGNSNFITIETVEELDENDVLIGYRHFINFQNLKLVKGEEYIIYEEEVFGEFVTEI